MFSCHAICRRISEDRLEEVIAILTAVYSHSPLIPGAEVCMQPHAMKAHCNGVLVDFRRRMCVLLMLYGKSFLIENFSTLHINENIFQCFFKEFLRNF